MSAGQISNLLVSQTPIGKQVLRVDEVALLLGCSERTVKDLARDGGLPGLKFGGSGWIFPLQALLDHLNESAALQMCMRYEDTRNDGTPPISAVPPLDWHNTNPSSFPPGWDETRPPYHVGPGPGPGPGFYIPPVTSDGGIIQ